MAVYVALAALASLLPGLILLFLTRKRWPRVASATMKLLGISLGVIGLFVTMQQVQQGFFEGEPTSRYFKAPIRRDESPIHFWLLASFFGVPSLLLVGGGLMSLSRSLLRLARRLARSGEAEDAR
jgi:hypothetical protein